MKKDSMMKKFFSEHGNRRRRRHNMHHVDVYCYLMAVILLLLSTLVHSFTPSYVSCDRKVKCDGRTIIETKKKFHRWQRYSKSVDAKPDLRNDDSSTAMETKTEEDLELWNALLDRFQGDFDNYDQVVEDRKNGLAPKEGGGHEHIHCTLLPLPSFEGEKENVARIVAIFYFNGMPQRIFRLRLYTLFPEKNKNGVHMILATFQSSLESALKQKPLHQWMSILEKQYQIQNRSWDNLCVTLPKCDVLWKNESDPQQHSYAIQNNPENAFHALMCAGPKGTVVPSQMAPGSYINIRDELSLWQNDLWINDRGLDPHDSTKFIYGNQRGIPYKLKRVTNNIDFHLGKPRKIHDPRLWWTLGPDYRTESFYQQKMDVII